MSVKQIKDEIGKLNKLEKTEIYRWLDVQKHAANLLSGIGVYRLVADYREGKQKGRVIS
jgi:hypothetical protein